MQSTQRTEIPQHVRRHLPAKIAEQNDEYFRTASRLRELARKEYGCVDFVSVTDGQEEISLSYWETREEIDAWKNDAEHLAAQRQGKIRWYRRYEVRVAEVMESPAVIHPWTGKHSTTVP